MWGVAFLPSAGADGGGVLVASNGSSLLLHLHARSLRLLRAVRVVDAALGLAIEGLNELEVVEGEVWANVYPMWQRTHSACVARIWPDDGRVLGWVDLTALARTERAAVTDAYNNVLNGIAYNHTAPEPPPRAAGGADGGGARRHRPLLVTGKNWGAAYRIQLAPHAAAQAGSTAAGAAHVRRVCGLYAG